MRLWSCLLLGVTLGGCASTLDGALDVDARLDAPIDSGGFPDAGRGVDAMTRFDGGALNGFNGPCHDRNECETGLCLLAPTGGYCTRMCTAGGCPEGFGCYGVGGLIEPGVILFVCVKGTSLLCSPCASASECGTIAADLCLPSPTGGKFCARDCTMQPCPTGYDCQTVANGADAGVARQCVPASGACDCQMQDTGATKDCPITTPLGTECQGERTCLGSAGWSECMPPATTDVPDGTYTDDNCDGIDGDLDEGVFVATAANGGEDNADCGALGNPCATVGNGARRAKLTGKRSVYVQAGTYNETVTLRDGVSIYGGYDLMWQRAARSTVGHQVRIIGQLSTADDQYIAVVAHDLAQATTLADLDIVGGQATGSANNSGRSSYAVHAAAANLILERVTINAGRGAGGQTGAAGVAAPRIDAEAGMVGKKGGNGSEGASFCNSTSRGAGGLVGENFCGDYTGGSTVAGAGGAGGTKDTSCNVGCTFGNCTARPGDAGNPAAVWVTGSYGYGGSPGSGGVACGFPGPGGPGRVVNGGGGPGGMSGGRLVGRYWYAFPGSPGRLGQHGGGGGGGGGAGGCAAQLGGSGGEGGGGSFGLFAVEGSTVTLRFVTIEQANGGRGGTGGAGAQGQTGGGGGPGGTHSGDDKDGGGGGAGGQGGHSGGGGGGAGGASYGVFLQGASVNSDDSNIFNDAGAIGGDGGDGGGAPLAPTRGNAGLPGTPGGVGKFYTCVNPSRC